MKMRFVRPGQSLGNDHAVARGGGLDPEVIRADARRMFSVYGVFGVSVLAVRDVTLDELAQQPPLVRFAELTLLRVGRLRAAGLGFEATGAQPSPLHDRDVRAGDRCRGAVCLRAGDVAEPVP